MEIVKRLRENERKLEEPRYKPGTWVIINGDWGLSESDDDYVQKGSIARIESSRKIKKIGSPFYLYSFDKGSKPR